ncbi:putative quinol monooxygenase [Wenzhouxiangella marina]|uniref:Antibiotic biosynthesis monooxygenase family protein n=1 Tax=Wenzhouxiangella marina TaxID=1579979 RepID=A0A0K0XU11_9GAMM|nr:antibiotic biosynthesis monooxygenase [Wenzhouxiangella marina]AKS41150.1 Antibiotic biosynthesis monooxygenase family protein [Wenzhouxiangella marina]MBB6088029.1 quinol monooxygenase YgiN [Wenzhouxiangella marina]
MFIAVYEFDVKEGRESAFRAAWVEVTEAIYAQCGSLGSRLHSTNRPNIFVGYAQWPSRAQWEKDHVLLGEGYERARATMRDCLVSSKTIHELEVCDDYLQSEAAER